MAISSDNIYDSCAGSPIGLLVDLDLTGTPPFDIRYEIINKNTKDVQQKSAHIEGMRHQLELKPSDAGHYTYRFPYIKDSVYGERSVFNDQLQLEQDVKPPASARFADSPYWTDACLDESVPFNVTFQGESPWTLEYEIIHGGSRKKQQVENIEENRYTISTDRLSEGGEYTVALVSVQDQTRCKVFLSEEVKIDVRQQRPKAAYGQIDGKLTVTTLENQTVSLPLRLTGQPPWTVYYRAIDSDSSDEMFKKLHFSNDGLEVSQSGRYQLVDMRDAVCPGTIDEDASTFAVEWVSRPSLRISGSAARDMLDGTYVKDAVCEGDEDSTEIVLQGTLFTVYTVTRAN